MLVAAGREMFKRRRSEPRVLLDTAAHVDLNLGRCEGPVVDPDIVNQSAEVFSPDAVSADAERTGTRQDRTGPRLTRNLDAVYEEAQRCAVVRRSHVGPGIRRDGAGAEHGGLRRCAMYPGAG